ncbi:hypothetical protein RND71_043403 [Anisodus tanguticus]|uniref:Structural maintenance of chromosomes protein n=1 Tax=Anisodus tanguticus TaxID=243964 RepID=A0AAE1QN71_9SOLA|nr:hypothetical protein RND71_043403 [Anisodus tanguticus]
MYIKSITIDGFKSYAEKTVINNFDRSFNAITGLNGSGKSNILDSICFVLGITNMNLVRVNNLRELIYKNGQAGVTKAQVCIEFDNTDKQNCPTGYENDNVITLRKEINLNNSSKYFINGDKKTTSQVNDFFHSVQLNINNPHFLIMQGRITKVINMKPREVLGMIEEATNISMYENKKKESYQMIDKKEIDLKNIDILINESIIPKLKQLKQDQVKLIEYQKVNSELEHSMKIYTAWRYVENKNMCEKSEVYIEEKVNKKKEINDYINELSSNIEEIEKKVIDLEKEKDSEFGDKLGKLDEELKKTQEKESKEQTNLNLKKDAIKEEEKRKKEVEKLKNDDNKLLKQKQAEFDKVKNTFEHLKEAFEQNEKELEDAQKKLQAISAGLTCENGKITGSLQDQLTQAQREIKNFETQTITLKNELQAVEKELTRKQKELNHLNSNTTGTEQMHNLQLEVSNLEEEMNSLNFDEQKLQELNEMQNKLSQTVNDFSEKIRRIYLEIPMLSFNYNSPVPNFDRSKVLGVVASLFKVKDPKFYKAIEKAAGGKLFNVVVDNEETAKLILNKCHLDRKRTILPISVLKGRSVDIPALKNAEKLVGKENVFSAASLIEYDEHLDEVIKYVFGDTLICTDLDSANKVTFAKNVLKRTVTLDGDVFDPSGTLSGGSTQNTRSILFSANEIENLNANLKEVQLEMNRLEAQINDSNSLLQKYNFIKNKFDKKHHDLEMIKIQFTKHINLTNEIESLNIKLNNLKTDLQNAEENKISLSEKIKELQLKITDSKAAREKELKEAKASLEKAKKNKASSKNFAEEEKKINSLSLEIEEIKKSIELNAKNSEDLEKIISEYKVEFEKEEEKFKLAKEEVHMISEKIKEQKNLLRAHCNEINKLQKQKNDLDKKIDENHLKIKDIDHQIDQIKSKTADSKKIVSDLMKNNFWIKEEEHLFNNPNAGYGFDNFNSDQFVKKIKKLESEKSSLEKTVNLKAQVALKDKESELEELKNRREIIETDKHKLLQYIDEVDREKLKTLEAAYEKVNKDFGDIFSTLLPGTQAKLERFVGKPIYEGLKIRIAFGNIWKESLTELSGGQRSLVALSLIFSLLLYKPAPIYILDEVDAALDQNHTQNIGIMIKKHFARSQFIIVSLKDDMFNNANVLFKTKFINGTSTVNRFTKS